VRPSWLVIVILTLATHTAAAQVPSVRVDSARGRLEVVFPALPLSRSGCRYTGNLSAETGRLYSWTLGIPFPDSRYPNNHIFEFRLDFFLPDTIELTQPRFDSIVAANPPTVAELYGEPPGVHSLRHPAQSSVHRGNGRLTLRIQGREAVNALLETGAERVGLRWCQGSEKPDTFRAVPLQRH
jgi:hypothetical protein